MRKILTEDECRNDSDREAMIYNQRRAAAKRGSLTKRLRAREQRIIESPDLVNPIGQIKLSADGMRGLLTASRLFQGESNSRVIDRLLRRAYINKVALVSVFPVPIYQEMEKIARERGYADAEELIEDTMITAFKYIVKDKPYGAKI